MHKFLQPLIGSLFEAFSNLGAITLASLPIIVITAHGPALNIDYYATNLSSTEPMYHDDEVV